jgi:hypothetical protein
LIPYSDSLVKQSGLRGDDLPVSITEGKHISETQPNLETFAARLTHYVSPSSHNSPISEWANIDLINVSNTNLLVSGEGLF